MSALLHALCVIVLLQVSSASAQGISPGRITIIEKGIYVADTIAHTPTHGTTGGINTVQNPRLITNTTTILGAVGVRFGVRYLFTTSIAQHAQLRLVNSFPAPGLRRPDTQQNILVSEQIVAASTGAVNYWEYHFESEWEIVPGIWTFTFWHQGRKLAEQRFCVVSRNMRQSVEIACPGLK